MFRGAMNCQDCIFCKIATKQIATKVVYETQNCMVFPDIAPQAPIHYLVIPKPHVQDLASCTDQSLLAELMTIPGVLARQLGPDTAFKLFTNNGYAAGQRVFHLHFHFLSGKTFSE